MADKLQDTRRMCVHTQTTKPWSLAEAIEGYTRASVPGITVWRDHIAPYGAEEAGKMLRDSGLEVVSLCRGGFFPATSGQARLDARNDNRAIIDEAVAIGAPLVVLVCGASPEIELPVARQMILDGLADIEPHAKDAGVKLAIEPLHPMYADTRSAINTMDQANNMIMALGSNQVGIAVDVYHVWWDSFLKAEIGRAKGSIFAFHVCDWRTPTRNLLTDREIMGKGCIRIREIREWVEQAGFNGFIEVEIFSDDYWKQDQDKYLWRLKSAFLNHV